MITVNSINGSPETIPSKHFGSFSDGQVFIFFESDDERETYLNSLPIVWSKEAHIAEINAEHKAYFEEWYSEKNYDGEWELLMYAKDETLGYQEEAQEILDYWTIGWTNILLYAETVTEETQKTLEQIMDGL